MLKVPDCLLGIAVILSAIVISLGCAIIAKILVMYLKNVLMSNEILHVYTAVKIICQLIVLIKGTNPNITVLDVLKILTSLNTNTHIMRHHLIVPL